MRTGNLSLLCFALAILIGINIIGCSKKRPPPPKSPSVPEEISKPPGSFSIFLEIKDWTIVDHRILDYDASWGRFRRVGRFAYLNKLVFKFKSDKYPEHYWLANIPEVKDGSYEIRAIRYREPSSDLSPVEPPEKFSIALIISNGRVINHVIQDPHPGWGQFIVDRYKKGILYLKNSFYPDRLWGAKMPRKDGEWTIYAILIR